MVDIFVSYASPDRDAAFRIVSFLEEHGITCWVAPRDVPPGVEYGQAIIEGIGDSRALVLILSDQSNESQFVRKEVERAVSKTKPVLPVRIREVTPSGSLEFFISSAQWVDAWKSPIEQHLLPLVAAIKQIGQPGAARVRSSTLPLPKKKSNVPLVAAAAGLLALATAGGAWWIVKRPGGPAVPPAITAPAPAEPGTRVGTATPAAAISTAAPPLDKAPVSATTAAEQKPSARPKRSDVAFVTGSWCQPYQGRMIRYNVLRTGSDTVLTQVNHPMSPPFDAPSKVVAIKGGFEFRPVDEEPDGKNVSRFEILDDATMKLVFASGEVQDGIVRTRCAPEK
jgi:TIR domain